MKYVITSLNVFKESVNHKKTIYHFTYSMDSLFEILSGDFLMAGSHNGCNYGYCYDNISFTWNPNLWDIEYLGDSYKKR